MSIRKKLLIVIGLVTALFISFISGAAVQEYSSLPLTPPALIVTAPTEQDPALLTLANQVGADVTNVTLKYTTFSNADERAYFSYSQTSETISYMIELRPGLDPNRARQSFVHEYYHYIWKSHPETQAITGALQGMYAADDVMHDRMKIYVDDGLSPNTADFDNELFAIYCTEVYTPTLEPTVAAECMKWVDLGSITSDRNL